MPKRNNDNRDGALPSRQNETTLCKYQGKRCLNPRAVKTTGKLHSLCDQHRKNANDTQRKSQRAKKMKVKANPSESMRLTLDDPLFLLGRNIYTEKWRCTYSKGQNCKSVRAIKSNGEHHRFCDYHAKRAKVHRNRSLKRKRGGLDPTSHLTFGTSATFTYKKFQCVGGMRPRGQCEVLTSRGRGRLTLEVEFFATSKDVVSHIVLGTVDKIQSHEPLYGIMGNMHDDEVMLLHPHHPPWLPDFVDEIYASLDQWLQHSDAGF